MLLAKTLTSSTFRVALIATGAFGVIVSAIFGYVYQDGTRLTVIGDREVLVTGDRDLIFDAIANLVDNSIKHGRAGGQVVVANENIDGTPAISITDDGPGIR